MPQSRRDARYCQTIFWSIASLRRPTNKDTSRIKPQSVQKQFIWSVEARLQAGAVGRYVKSFETNRTSLWPWREDSGRPEGDESAYPSPAVGFGGPPTSRYKLSGTYLRTPFRPTGKMPSGLRGGRAGQRKQFLSLVRGGHSCRTFLHIAARPPLCMLRRTLFLYALSETQILLWSKMLGVRAKRQFHLRAAWLCQ